MNRLYLILNTLKFLKCKQFVYRVFYILRNRFFKKNYTKELSKVECAIVWESEVPTKNSYLGNQTFSFLNQNKKFEDTIDWNYSEFGKLWTFNLNYFDFLNQQEINKAQGLDLILDYINNDASLKEGKAAYTISLRGMNWIKFLSKNNIQNKIINQALYNHFQILVNNLEYHLLGNHLLENGFALLFGAYYFKDEQLYKKAENILSQELEEQVLQDGAHFELSPMYHQIMLFRVLDCVQLLQSNNWKSNKLQIFLMQTAIKMLSWLQSVTFKNGDIPMVNDSTYEIAPSSNELFQYAKVLGLEPAKNKLSDSGYRMFKEKTYELFVDVGHIGASYQPAHAHSDTFNFVLHVKGKPIIVDRGITTYEKNKIRQEERGTSSHNTIKIGDIDQTQVWGGFRVAKRAEIIQLNEGDFFIEATHDGYKSLNCIHTRKFTFIENEIKISDNINNIKAYKQIAYLHFHPNIKELDIHNNIIKLKSENIHIMLSGEMLSIQKENYLFSLGYNQTTEAIKVKIAFKGNLMTLVKL